MGVSNRVSQGESMTTRWWQMATVTLAITVVVLGIFVWREWPSHDASGARPVPSVASSEPAAVAATSAATTAPAPFRLTDFSVDVIVVENKCYGSAGCNVQYTIKANYLGAADLTGRHAKVVYAVLGGSQSQTESFTLDGYTTHYEETSGISTDSENAVLSAKVSNIIETQS